MTPRILQILLFGLLFDQARLLAQNDFRSGITYNELPSLIQDRKRTVLSIEALRYGDEIDKVNPIPLGSGFLTIISGKQYAVTNYHVANSLERNQRILVGVNLKQGKLFIVASIIAVDSIGDIAILGLTDSWLSKTTIPSGDIHLDQASIGVSTYSDTTEFQQGQGVVLLGFPLAIGSESFHNQPIARIGIIALATDPSSEFLIDGIASHGNSGSPVFDATGGKLLGMVVGFPSDYISAFDENKQLIARLPYNSGLSVCVSSRRILKLITSIH